MDLQSALQELGLFENSQTLLSAEELEEKFYKILSLLHIFPQYKASFKKTLENTLAVLGKYYESTHEYSKLLKSYQFALAAYSNHEGLLSNLGAHLLRSGHMDIAAEYFREALKVNRDYLPALRNLETFNNLCVERWHFRMLNDEVRNSHYKDAIIKKVKQGYNCILDIGTGTGLFCLYAAEAGAKEIYACDSSNVMIDICRDVLERNKASDKVTLIPKSSNDLKIPLDVPKRVPLVVTETLDVALIGENILQTLVHAWDVLLLPPPCEKENLPVNSSRFISEANKITNLSRVNILKSSLPETECANTRTGGNFLRLSSDESLCHRSASIKSEFFGLTSLITECSSVNSVGVHYPSSSLDRDEFTTSGSVQTEYSNFTIKGVQFANPVSCAPSCDLHEARTKSIQVNFLDSASVDAEFPSSISTEYAVPLNASFSDGVEHASGCVIPLSARVWISAVECDYFNLKYRVKPNFADVSNPLHSSERNLMDCWNILTCNFFAYDGSNYDCIDIQKIPDVRFLNEPTTCLEVSFFDRDHMKLLNEGQETTATLICNKGGRVDAFVMWFDLKLDEEIQISSAPFHSNESAKCWEQAVFPLPVPAYVTDHHTIQLKVCCASGNMAIKLCSLGKPEDIDKPSTSKSNHFSMILNNNDHVNSLPDCGQYFHEHSNVACYPVSYDIVKYLNDQQWRNSLNQIFQFLTLDAAVEKQWHFLDLSPFPLIGLAFLVYQQREENKCNCKLTCVAFENQDRDAIIAIAKENNIGNECLKIISAQFDEVFGEGHQYDFIMFHPVESTGRLHEKFIVNLPLFNAVKKSCVFMPKEIVICCQLINSQWLKEVSELQGKETVCGYDIAPVLNTYKGSEHLNFSLPLSQHEIYSKVCETPPISMEQFETSVAEPMSFQMSTRIREDGFVNAIPYWFKIRLHECCEEVSTNCLNGAADQAVILVSPPLEVKANDCVSVTITCHQGLMNIQICKEYCSAKKICKKNSQKLLRKK